jgi:integral membrane protein (TIGR01906 family)
MITALLGLAILFILNVSGCFELCRPFGKHVAFSSGLFTLTGFAVIGGLAATDFDRAFTIFHKLFFPGKSNWLFSWYEDEIIRILPQEFFMNCAILILVSIITLCILAIILGGVSKKKINC